VRDSVPVAIRVAPAAVGEQHRHVQAWSIDDEPKCLTRRTLRVVRSAGASPRWRRCGGLLQASMKAWAGSAARKGGTAPRRQLPAALSVMWGLKQRARQHVA